LRVAVHEAKEDARDPAFLLDRQAVTIYIDKYRERGRGRECERGRETFCR
jgi:hypothetical protein